MLVALLFAAALQAAAPPPEAPAEQGDEIVVTAVREKCRVMLADRILSDREFSQRAKLWAQGRPVRVVSPAGANYKCLAKIAFRLQARGVRLIQFVDRPERP